MKYTVGQILFVVLNKKNQVYPMLVVEEITKKTLKGEEVNYVLQGGPEDDSTIMLDKVDGEVFDSAKEARDILVNRVTLQIEKLISAAVEKSQDWYGEKREVPHKKELQTKNDEEKSVVVLPDGTTARLKI